MKKVLLICFTAMFVPAIAQDDLYGVHDLGPKKVRSTIIDTVNNFILADRSVKWQKVFEHTDLEVAHNYFAENGPFLDLRVNENTIAGRTAKEALDYKKHGYKTTNIPVLFQQPCEIFFVIEFKDDKYRVTVDKIIWSSGLNLSFGYVSTNSNAAISLHELAYRNNGKAKDTFTGLNSELLDVALTGMFDISIRKNQGDNW